MPCNFYPLKKFPLFNGIKSHAYCSTDLETLSPNLIRKLFFIPALNEKDQYL